MNINLYLVSLVTYYLYHNLILPFRNTICELCSRWGLCSVPTSSNQNANNNPGEDRNVPVRVFENHFIRASSPQTEIINRSGNASPIFQQPTDNSRKRSLRVPKVKSFMSFSLFKAKEGGKTDNGIELNIVSATNMTDKTSLPTSDKDNRSVGSALHLQGSTSNGMLNVSAIPFNQTIPSSLGKEIVSEQAIQNSEFPIYVQI